MSAILPSNDTLKRSRSWLIFLGILSLLVGIFAIAEPILMTMAIVQVVGLLLVITGAFSLVAVVFGHEKNHRIATVILALIRLVAGLALFIYVGPGMIALATVLCAFFFVEGVIFLISALGLRHNRAWPLMFLNGIVAIVLGGMIFAHLPSSAEWVIGLLYGINSIFYGVQLLGFAAASRTAA